MVIKAGIILINGNKIGLIYRDKQKDYSFPNGHLEENESLIECAIRETNEETKREVNIINKDPIYIEIYTNSYGEKCKCYYYLGYDNGHSDNDSEDTHDLIWIDFNKVEETLSHKSLKKLWNKIKEEVKEYIKE